MKSMISTGLEVAIAVFITLAVVLIPMVTISYYVERGICEQKSEVMNVDHSFGFWSGCMIEIEDGKYIPLDSYYYKEEK